MQAVVAKGEMRRLLPDDSARSLVIATGLGAASSSCSYRVVALARSIFRKGADFTAAMAFQFASTNLVVELGIIMALLVGQKCNEHRRTLRAGSNSRRSPCQTGRCYPRKPHG